MANTLVATLLALTVVFHLHVLAVVGCPERCQCVGQTQVTVSCIDSHLSSIPDGLPRQTEALYLKNNGIKVLQQGSFQNLPLLRTLVITGCGVETIEPNAFTGLRSLTKLDLRLNQIQELEAYAFSGLFNLRRLDLEYNDISIINNFAFHGLNLTKLTLEHNAKLREIAHKAFQNAHIHMLNFNNATLSSSSAHALTPLSSSLRELSWINNQLPLNIPTTLFQDFTFASLNLNNNYMRNASFLRFTTTNDLSLLGNPLGTLDFSNYPTLKQVRYVRLQNTNFSTLKASYFEGMSHLTQLYLSHNDIKLIPNEMRGVFTKIGRLVLEGNPLHCNCDMLWFRDWMQTTDVTVIGATCVTPEEDDVLSKPRDLFICITPTILKLTRSVNTTKEVNVLSLSCVAEGDPPPAIIWMAPDGKVISSTPPRDVHATSNTASIVMTSIGDTHQGAYKCMASNSAGNATMETDIDAYDVLGLSSSNHSSSFVLSQSIPLLSFLMSYLFVLVQRQ